MTLLRWRTPVVVALLLVTLSWSLGFLPQDVVNVIRLTNGFAIVAMFVWFIQRVLRYEERLDRFEAQILGLIQLGEKNRTIALANLQAETARIALELAAATGKKTDEAIHAAEQRHAAIKERLDEVLDKKATERTAEQRHESIEERLDAVIDGQEASKPVIEDTHTIAQDIADHVKGKD